MCQDSKLVLTIAGSDSSGGAGVQADLKAFSHAGVHGASVITAVTSQNSSGVSGIFSVPVAEIERQLEAVCTDMKPAWAKCGMLYCAESVLAVAWLSKKFNLNLVVDPVLVATSGDKLAKDDLLAALKDKLLPGVFLAKPNTHEAEALTGINIKSVSDMENAAQMIAGFGVRNVLVTGGHLGEGHVTEGHPDCENSVDVLLTEDGKYHHFLAPRVKNHEGKHMDVHGTGCTTTALITAYLAGGLPILDAVGLAKLEITRMIEESHRLGEGIQYLSSPSGLMPAKISSKDAEMVGEYSRVISEVANTLPVEFIAEVGLNMSYARKGATGSEDILALTGRIVRVGQRGRIAGQMAFGASRHTARIVLAVLKFYPEYRCVLNLKYRPQYVTIAKEAGLVVESFSRANQPPCENSSMSWGTADALKRAKETPDIIYDTGGFGKEPMIRVLGKIPKDVLAVLKKLV